MMNCWIHRIEQNQWKLALEGVLDEQQNSFIFDLASLAAILG
jgi:hypothetical protein